jgi:hypothetical protein
MTRDRRNAAVVHALAVRIVGIAGRLVPTGSRDDWEREWRAELWHLSRELEACGGPSAWQRVAFVRRSLGAVADALQLRLGDAQLWRDNVSAVAAAWGRRPGSVGLALFLLSLGIGGAALLVAFGGVMIEAPRSVWGNLVTETRLLILGVAAACGVLLIVTSAAAAARLLGPAGCASDRDGAWIVETVLVGGATGWLARWFAELYVRTAMAPYPTGWVGSTDLAAAVTSACVLSWLCGLALLTGLRMRRARSTGAGPA